MWGRGMDCVPEDKWKEQFTEIAGSEANGHHLPGTSTSMRQTEEENAEMMRTIMWRIASVRQKERLPMIDLSE